MTDKNKKSRFDFSAMTVDASLHGLATLPARRAPGDAQNSDDPVTFPGRVAAQTTKSLQEKIQELESRLSSGDVIVRVDPKTVGHSDLANRDPRSLAPDDPELQHLVWLLETQGQQQPVRLRPAAPGLPHAHEVVFGHRRAAACRILDRRRPDGWPLLAIIDSKAVDSRYLAMAMHSENDGHKPLSAYEYGRMYKSWLDSGCYPNQQSIAEAIKRDQSTVSQYICIAELPKEILAAFGDCRAISLRWLPSLTRALKADAKRVLAAAERLASTVPTLPPSQVLRALTDATVERRGPTSRRDAVMVNGRLACRITPRENHITLKFSSIVGASTQRDLAEEIKNWLEARLSGKPEGDSE